MLKCKILSYQCIASSKYRQPASFIIITIWIGTKANTIVCKVYYISYHSVITIKGIMSRYKH